jgi:hypothetical protein
MNPIPKKKPDASTTSTNSTIRHNKQGDKPLDRDGWVDVGCPNYKAAAVNRDRIRESTQLWWTAYEAKHPPLVILTMPDGNDTMEKEL